MSEDIFRQHMARKNQWMREREIDMQRQSLPATTPGDMVNQLTEKITSKLPLTQKKIDRNVADEIETNTCSICYELMLPKQHSPMLLFPCGHTFCKQCLDDNVKKTGKKICMWCRTRIQSSAINLSLQNLIVAYAKQKNIAVKETNDTNEQEADDDYLVQLENYNLRCSLLVDEKHNLRNEIKEIEHNIEVCEKGVDTLKFEEDEALKRLKAAEEELDLVRKHLSNSNNKLEQLYRNLNDKKCTVELIDETIRPLEREKEKIITLMNIRNNG